ncbi:periplasmic heavy metal sensor [Mucilaginibacter myungsuensis]|uniref:Periplasmic heavy metal sensor n=1 Tax=Mucilaginibacter myungsuensis TaxID=649104 RepID=A0A929KWU1_9SPHI|nr:periplasmic heavy metal sensor [Mucilaginibacter myungsuensis]MBE9662132.1 periplasmic heavy metal sensor [Mucilaginibacter myungsuensis]MDN3599434.1 periplasmic heavy metal sensor [Mucilaginibacter myungsuensis]
MKKLLLAACFVLGATAMSFAQGGGGQGGQGGGRGRMGGTPEEQTKALTASLKLTDDQAAKVKAIYTEQTAKRDSIMKAAGDDRQAMMQAFRPLMTTYQAKIQAVLTDEQKEVYKKQMAERMNRGGQGGGQGGQGGGTPPPPPTK